MPDANTPIQIGCGQITQREPDPKAALAPLDLTAEAARRALDDGSGRAEACPSGPSPAAAPCWS